MIESCVEVCVEQEGVAKLLEVVIMPAIKESLKEFSSQDHVLTEASYIHFHSTPSTLFLSFFSLSPPSVGEAS